MDQRIPCLLYQLGALTTWFTKTDAIATNLTSLRSLLADWLVLSPWTRKWRIISFNKHLWISKNTYLSFNILLSIVGLPWSWTSSLSCLFILLKMIRTIMAKCALLKIGTIDSRLTCPSLEVVNKLALFASINGLCPELQSNTSWV